VVSPPVSAANEAYNRAGVKLRYERAEIESGDDLFDSRPYVYVTTPSDRLVPEKCERATATGWALGAWSKFPSFPLSSHADFRQLVEFVRATRAKTVYIFTGYSDLFASYLQKRFGIDARPIPTVAQKRLLEFSR